MIIYDIDFLRKKSEIATIEEAKVIIEKLKEELLKHENGYGLSAIQIGIPKQVSIIKDRNGGFFTIINPVIIEKEEEFIFDREGCLSFPNIYGKTKRFEHFTIINQIIDGDSFRSETQYYYCVGHAKQNEIVDIEAIAVQHEIEHFWGLTIMDYGFDKYELKPQISQGEKSITGETVKNIDTKIGRNDPCPCGAKDNNGKPIKYKKCCLK